MFVEVMGMALTMTMVIEMTIGCVVDGDDDGCGGGVKVSPAL